MAQELATSSIEISSAQVRIQRLSCTYWHRCCRHPAWQTKCQWQRRSHTGEVSSRQQCLIVGLGDGESVCLTQCIQRRPEGDTDLFKFFEAKVSAGQGSLRYSHDMQGIQLSCTCYILVKTAYEIPCALLPIWAEYVAHSLKRHCD